MDFQEAFEGVYMAWANSARATEAKQKEFDAAEELYEQAKSARDSALAIENTAFNALLQFREDVLDGGWHDAPPTEAPAEPPVPMPEAPEVVQEPALPDSPVPEVTPMPSEPATSVEVPEFEGVNQFVPEVVVPVEPEAVDTPSADAVVTTLGDLTLPSMTDDSLVAKLPTASFGDEF